MPISGASMEKNTRGAFQSACLPPSLGGARQKYLRRVEKAWMKTWARSRPWQPSFSHELEVAEACWMVAHSPHYPPPQQRGPMAIVA